MALLPAGGGGSDFDIGFVVVSEVARPAAVRLHLDLGVDLDDGAKLIVVFAGNALANLPSAAIGRRVLDRGIDRLPGPMRRVLPAKALTAFRGAVKLELPTPAVRNGLQNADDNASIFRRVTLPCNAGGSALGLSVIDAYG
ncbi:hypothetical protein [Bradyrhizobium ivorense]|uniref:hypothetical protein n=1 Tax=Bradyrhizobium ivorense TaxID=2511166 RepID=UPI001115FAA8|nr:hypothetical protein [Bradyrhizobium ivorense]